MSRWPDFLRAGRWLAPVAFVALVAACGGGGGGGGSSSRTTVGTGSVAAGAVAGSNVVQITVDTGTDGTAVNAPFVTVTICEPATANCRSVDHVILDTGSNGLRIAASALAGLNMPAETAGGLPVGECSHFASGYSWGAVRRADVKMGGEVAASLPIQVINDPGAAYSTIPGSCSSTGFNIGAGRGAKGILGTGLFKEDCPLCVASTSPAVYFACNPLGGCAATTLPLASQVANPVASFASTNTNGVTVVMPSVPSGGAALATGWLIFGVGTQANNALGGATVYPTTAQGFFTTRYRGVNYANSFLDTGSNGYFFNDATIPSCGDFYCPGSTLSLSATNTAGAAPLNSGTVTFPLDSVLDLRSDVAAAHIGGTNGLPGSFDWGLPFFFGRTVFTVRSGAASPAGAGPYWAY